MNRRIFLKGVGGVALAAPFLGSLHEKEAKAQATPPPRRSVVYHTHNGCITNRWFPKVSNGALTAAAFEGTTLAGLAPQPPVATDGRHELPRGLDNLDGRGALAQTRGTRG